MKRRIFAAILLLAPLLYGLTPEEQEVFLKKAKVQKKTGVSKGVTGTSRVTLSDGSLTHDASVQNIDEFKGTFQPQGKATQFNFKDSYRFNIAAYMLAKQLGLGDMVPPSVERGGGSYTWWIDDVLMDDNERAAKRAEAPNPEAWNNELALVRVFDQLIANDDRNGGNLIMDQNWRVWMIDHTRAFRTRKEVESIAGLTAIDRGVLAKIKSLEEAQMRKDFGKLLDKDEIKSLLSRRDQIVKVFAERGDGSLFDRPAR
jgi:hypothetical protein